MQRPHRRLHAGIWLGLTVLLPMALLAAFLARPDPEHVVPPVRFDAPPQSPTPGAKP